MGEQKRSLLRQLYLPAVLCTALWGSAAPCVKRGYELFAVSADAPFSQLVFAGWRFALAGILVLLVTRLKGHRIVPKRDEIKPILVISLFQSMLQYVCYYIGLSGTTGTKGSVLSGTQTFFALLLAHCLLPNDKLNRRKTLGCICGFAGVLALGLGGLNGFNLTGDGLVLLSAVSAGAGALVSRIYTPGRDPMLLTGWQLLIGGCFLLGVGTMGGGALGRVTLGGVLLLGYMIVLSPRRQQADGGVDCRIQTNAAEQAAGGDAQSLAGKVDGFFGLFGGFRSLFCRLHGEELCFQIVRSVKVVYLHLVLIPPHLRFPPSASYVTVRGRGEAS